MSMGFYIDMEMPTSCFYCPFRIKVDPDNIKCLVSGVVFEETFTGSIEMRHSGDCPLVPVPPHGRLIDADELKALVYANIALFDSAPGRMGAEQKVVRAWLASMVDDIDDAPTIIPAEEGET